MAGVTGFGDYDKRPRPGAIAPVGTGGVWNPATGTSNPIYGPSGTASAGGAAAPGAAGSSYIGIDPRLGGNFGGNLGMGQLQTYLNNILAGGESPFMKRYMGEMGKQMTVNQGNAVANAMSKAGASGGGIGSQAIMLGNQAANQSNRDIGQIEANAALQEALAAPQAAIGLGNLNLGGQRLGLEGAVANQNAVATREQLGLTRQEAAADQARKAALDQFGMGQTLWQDANTAAQEQFQAWMQADPERAKQMLLEALAGKGAGGFTPQSNVPWWQIGAGAGQLAQSIFSGY